MTGFLFPFPLLYRVALALWDFSWRFRPPAYAPGPVISIGNLVVGGTGKTPLTLALARFLWKRGKSPAILSRGYGRKSRELLVVQDTTEPREAGDEPFLLYKKLQGKVPVVVGKNRILGAQKAARLGARVFLLDDGFQYRRLARALDLVVFLPHHLRRPPRLLPAGPLREPFTALHRAHLIIVNLKLDPPDPSLPSYFWGKPLYPVRYRFRGLRKGETFLPPEEVQGKKAFAFCGIADPQSFRRAMLYVGLELLGFQVFWDHHWYGERELEGLIQEARSVGAEFVITTEKDAVRIPSPWDEHIWVFEIEVELPEPLLQLVERRVQGV